MNGTTRSVSLFFIAFSCASSTLQAAAAQAASAISAPGGHFDDAGNLFSANAGWKQRWAGKLDEFERETGIKVLVEFHPKSPPADEDRVPSAFMHALSAKHGLDQQGILAVYFADEDDWRVWIGDELTPVFVGRAGTVKELTESKAIHDTKEAFFAETTTKTDAAFSALQKSSPPEHSATPADRLRIHTEMLLEGLMDRLRAKTADRPH